MLIVLAVANRSPITLALNPFDPADRFLSVTAPLFVFIFVTFALGAICGGLLTWLRDGRVRKRARSATAEAKRWHSEADRLKERAETLEKQSAPTAAIGKLQQYPKRATPGKPVPNALPAR